MATKTHSEYRDEYLNLNKGNTEEQIEKNKQGTAASINQYNQGVDTQVQASVNPYQQRIDEAPAAFQEQYDANHINELFNRKKVQESMANMGLTDSGLNRSQQTALSVQRGNADAATRKQQQDYVTAAQQAIDQIIATGESQKQQHAAQRNLEADNYANSLWQSLYSNADTYATDMVIADQEAAAKAAENDLKLSLAMLDKGYVPDGNGGYVAAPATAGQQYEALVKQNENRNKYVAGLIADGVPVEKANYMGIVAYPTENENLNAQAVRYMQAQENGYDADYSNIIATSEDPKAELRTAAGAEIKKARIDTGSLAKFHSASKVFDWMTSEEQDVVAALGYSQSDWNASVGKIYDQALKNINKTNLSAPAKEYAVAEAVGKAIKKVSDLAAKNRDAASIEVIATRMRTALEGVLSEDLVGVACEIAGIVKQEE